MLRATKIKRLRSLVSLVLAVGCFSIHASASRANVSLPEDNGMLYRYSEASYPLNIYIRPLDIAISGGGEIELGAEVPITSWMSGGIALRHFRGLGVRLQTELYFTNQVFNDSWVLNVHYTAANISGPGILAGYRFFWAEYGQSGINLGILAGPSSEGDSGEYYDRSPIIFRVDFGVVF